MSHVRRALASAAAASAAPAPAPAPEPAAAPRVLLNRLMAPSFQRSIASPATFAKFGDTGGILLGRFLPGRPLTLLIEGFHALAWDAERGGAPHLMSPHTRLLEQTIAQYQNRPPISVLGFYRSSRAGELELTDADRDLFNCYFHDPFSVYMLVRPISYNTSIGAIYWHNRQHDPDPSTTIEIGFDNDASYLPGSRSSLRNRAKNWGRTAVQVITVAAGLALPVGYMAWQAMEEATEERAIADADKDSRVQLNLLRTGPDLLITWQRFPAGGSPLVSGKLTVSDSDFRKEFLLDREQLASGRLLYQPLTNDVTVRMEARTAKDVRVTDTMRAFRPATAPPPVATPAGVVAGLENNRSTPVREHVIDVQSRPERRAEADAAPPKRRTPATAESRFVPPAGRPLADRASLPAPVMLEPPPLALAIETELRNPVNYPEQSRPPAAPAWEREGVESVTPALPGGYQFTAAVAIRSPKPEYPAILLRDLSRPVTISIRAQIDSSGNVVSTRQPATDTATEKLLAAAAERAAKKWKFRPATLNGVAVPGEVTINFRFVP